MVICLLGPDGVGKSTIIDFFRKKHDNLLCFHLKPIKSDIVDFNSVAEACEPHSAKNYNKFVSYIKLIYLVFLYNFGWFVNVVSSKKESLIIFDRYLDDMMVDPGRFRFSGDQFFVKIALKLVPRPDMYFILHASSDNILNRKKELTRLQIDDINSNYLLLAKNSAMHVVINANSNPDMIFKEILKQLKNYYEC
jgi:thymidylate kinase